MFTIWVNVRIIQIPFYSKLAEYRGYLYMLQNTSCGPLKSEIHKNHPLILCPGHLFEMQMAARNKRGRLTKQSELGLTVGQLNAFTTNWSKNRPRFTNKYKTRSFANSRTDPIFNSESWHQSDFQCQ